MLMIGLDGDPNKIEHDGFYEDTYVKTPQGGVSSRAFTTRCGRRGRARPRQRHRVSARREPGAAR